MNLPKIVACDARPNYELYLRFENGLEGMVYLGRLTELDCFAAWRDRRLFMTARADADNTVVWPTAGVRLDAEIFYRDIAAEQRYILPPCFKYEPGFMRFMRSVLERPKRKK